MIYFVVFGAFLLFFVLMAVGVMMKRKPLKGTCGGLNNIRELNAPCEICGATPEDPARCKEA
jgi:hypothetical protein